MLTPSLTHPNPSGSRSLRSRIEEFGQNSPENKQLIAEMSSVIDTFQSLDNGPSDLDSRLGYVHLKSPKGGSDSYFSSYSREVQLPSYRDREGYLETPTKKVLESAHFRRIDRAASGKPIREVKLDQAGSLLCKTVTDKHGTSTIAGGVREACRISFYPGDTLDIRA